MKIVNIEDKELRLHISRELNRKVDDISKEMFSGKGEEDDKVVKAVKTITEKSAVIDRKAKIIWLCDLKPEDLETQNKDDRFTIQRQLLSYQGDLRHVLSYIQIIDRMTENNFFRSWGRDKATDHSKFTGDLSAKFSNLKKFAFAWKNRGVSLINQSRAISARMTALKKKAPDPSPGVVEKWKRDDYTWHRSETPLELLGHPHALIAAPYLFKMDKKLKTLLEASLTVARSLCNVLFMNNKIILVEKPEIKRTDNGDFWRWNVHCDNGPAVYFPKLKKGAYYLNNVQVPKELVIKPADQIPAKFMTRTSNVEVRREIVRKIGVEKVLSDLGAEVIDKKDNYELVNLKLNDNENRTRPYLKMLNPSTGTWHIEGIRPGITTVDEALQYRNNGAGEPEILT
jgi:hypothetical protein